MKRCDKKYLLRKCVTIYREVIRGEPIHMDGIMMRRFKFRIPCFEYYVFNDEDEIILKKGYDRIFHKDKYFRF